MLISLDHNQSTSKSAVVSPASPLLPLSLPPSSSLAPSSPLHAAGGLLGLHLLFHDSIVSVPHLKPNGTLDDSHRLPPFACLPLPPRAEAVGIGKSGLVVIHGVQHLPSPSELAATERPRAAGLRLFVVRGTNLDRISIVPPGEEAELQRAIEKARVSTYCMTCPVRVLQ